MYLSPEGLEPTFCPRPSSTAITHRQKSSNLTHLKLAQSHTLNAHYRANTATHNHISPPTRTLTLSSAQSCHPLLTPAGPLLPPARSLTLFYAHPPRTLSSHPSVWPRPPVRDCEEAHFGHPSPAPLQESCVQCPETRENMVIAFNLRTEKPRA